MPVSDEFDFGALDEEREEEALGRELGLLFSRRKRFGRRIEGTDGADFEGEPIFDLNCTGCPVADCGPQLRQAMRKAIKLALNAADKLEATISVERDQRGPDARKTAQQFMEFFCHDPLLPIPWAGGEASGVSIVKRLRAVAKELGGGRKMPFKCLPTLFPCTESTCCPDQIAVVQKGEPIALCENFWKESEFDDLATVDQRAGFLIHEMLHFLFGSTKSERGILDRGPKRGIADCYESFVMRVNGLLVLRGKCKKCT
jgi:hypothetical protein